MSYVILYNDGNNYARFKLVDTPEEAIENVRSKEDAIVLKPVELKLEDK